MKWFFNLKTGAKLAFGFGICLILAAGVGTLALTRMGQMNVGTRQIVDDALDGMEIVAQLTDDIKQVRISEFRHLLETNVAEMTQLEGEMKDKISEVDKDLEENEKSAFLPEDKANAEELKRLWQVYMADHDRQIALGRQNRDKEGNALMIARIPKFNAVTDQLSKISDWNKKQGKQLADEAEKTYLGSRSTVLWLLGLAITLGFLAATFITKIITGALTKIGAAANGLAIGDIEQQIPINTKDEIGALADSFRALIAYQHEMANVAEAMAGGDLSRSVKPKSDKDVLGNAFALMLTNLSEIVGKARMAADSIASASSQVAAGNEDLSQRTEEQASSLEETASSMEEMTSTVKQNADNARQANQLAAQAREVAEKGGAVVSEAVTSMQEINQASKRIADIISVIDEIAFQTNLLALNASVEAARVGEQGKGFAVVAAEVRNLAGRSAAAAKEIKALVQDSVGKVQEGSSLVNQSGQQLDEIVSSVKKVADIIAEISAASQEQSAGIEQVSKAVMQMDQITQQNAALVEEASGATRAMAQQASGLREEMARFTLSESSSRGLIVSSPVVKSESVPVAASATGTDGAFRRGKGKASRAASRLVLSDHSAKPNPNDEMFEEF